MYIGIDLGGTNIAGALVGPNGDIVKKYAIPTDAERGSDAVIQSIIEVITHLSDGVEILGIGIGIPGIADPITGMVLACVNLNWYNVPLKDKLSNAFKAPIYIDNDATVAAVAEFVVAQENKYTDAVMLTLGTGVGGGIIINGKVASGTHGIGSELGHMIVGEGLYQCNCGRSGCLETFTSSTAIIKYARHLLETTDTPSELRLVNPLHIDGEFIFNAAKNGDMLANQVVDRLAKYLSIGIMNIVSVIDPQIIVLGGGLSHAGDFLLDKIKSQVGTLKYFDGSDVAKIEIAKLKNDAGLLGAAMLATL